MRPYSFSGAPDPSEGMLIVAARFWLADGTQLSGYLAPPPSDDRSLGVIQPQIVTYSGHVSFWCGVCPADSTRAYRTLGRDARSEFHIRFESAVPLVGGVVSGTLPGFLCLESYFETVKVVL